MQYTIHCPNRRCGRSSKPNAAQLVFIKKAITKKMSFIALDCPRCFGTVFFNPNDPDGIVPPKEPDVLFACPSKTCDGFVGHVKWKGYTPCWLCGECGKRWATQAGLNKAITAAVKRFPYRARCYAKTKTGWEPVELKARERPRYEKLVHKEWDL